MTTPTQAEVEAELAAREMSRRHLMHFVRRTYPGFMESWHHRVLCEALQRFSDDVAARRSPRLIVTMPPRHTKSTIVSQRLPVWHLGRHPTHDVVCASYAQTLANKHSRAARSLAVDAAPMWPHLAPSQERKAVEEWQVSGGGTYRAVGVGGGLTGMGAHVAIIDDPLKDWEAANSALVRQACKDWYDSVLATRLAPGAGILITQTRWHADDLSGWLLREDPDKWEVINLPALAEVDEEHRRKGEALHPGRYDSKTLEALKARNPMVFAALYQQRPVPAEGGLIKGEWLRKNRYATPAAPARTRRIVHCWDTASKAKEINDPSLCWVFGERDDDLVEVRDRWKGRVVFPDLIDQMCLLAARDNPGAVLIEDKSSGQEAITTLPRDPRWRWPIIPVTPTTDKTTRMATETPALEAGMVLWPEVAPWLADAWEVLLTFPAHAHDEEVDALSQYLWWRRSGADVAWRLSVLYG